MRGWWKDNSLERRGTVSQAANNLVLVYEVSEALKAPFQTQH